MPFPEKGSGIELSMDRHHQGAFDTLFKKLAAVFINAADRTCGVVGVSRAAAGAVKTRPALSALFSGIDITCRKIILHLGILYAVNFSSPTNWWQGYKSPQGVTAIYSVPEPQPEMRL